MNATTEPLPVTPPGRAPPLPRLWRRIASRVLGLVVVASFCLPWVMTKGCAPTIYSGPELALEKAGDVEQTLTPSDLKHRLDEAPDASVKRDVIVDAVATRALLADLIATSLAGLVVLAIPRRRWPRGAVFAAIVGACGVLGFLLSRFVPWLATVPTLLAALVLWRARRGGRDAVWVVRGLGVVALLGLVHPDPDVLIGARACTAALGLVLLLEAASVRSVSPASAVAPSPPDPAPPR
jgi:hypothetical protein